MRVILKLDSSKTIAKIEELQRRMPQAIARGLNAGGDLVKTQVQRSLKSQTGLLRYSSVTKRVWSERAYGESAPKSGIGPVGPGRFAYTIHVSGKATRPEEYKTAVTTGKGGHVVVFFWNEPHVFIEKYGGTRSFVATGGKFAGKLKFRVSPSRFKIRGFYGPDLAKEAVKDPTKAVFIESAATLVLPKIAAQIARLLK